MTLSCRSTKLLCVILILYLNLNREVSCKRSNVSASSDCKDLLLSFAIVSSNFTYCAIANARPITLCKSCIQSYLTVKEVYEDISHLEDAGGEMCKDQLFNLDRLQVVDSGFDYVANLWTRASCDTCFVNNEQRLTPEVQGIWNASSELATCITKHMNDSVNTLYDPKVCTECLNLYENLNNKYNSLKASTGDINFCMDVVDLINSTRSSWSGEMGCCKDRKKPEFVFLLSSTAIALAPLFFYVAAFTLSGKKEQKLAQQRRLAKSLTTSCALGFGNSST